MKPFRSAAILSAVLIATSSLLARAGEAEDRQAEIDRLSLAIKNHAQRIAMLESSAEGQPSNKDKIAPLEKELAEMEAQLNLLHYQQVKAKYRADLAAGGAESAVSPALNEILKLEKQREQVQVLLRQAAADPATTITPEQKKRNDEMIAAREKRIQELEPQAEREVISYLTQQALHGRFPESAKPDSEFSKKLAAKAAEPGHKAKLEANPKYLLYLARMVADDADKR